MVDNDLGFQQAPLMCYSRTKTLLFISNDKKVIGCLIAEHIQWVSDWIGKRQFGSVLYDSVIQTCWSYRITSEFKSGHLANKYSVYAFSTEEFFGGRPFWNVVTHFCIVDTELRRVWCHTWLRPARQRACYSWRVEFFFLCYSYASYGSPLACWQADWSPSPVEIARGWKSGYSLGLIWTTVGSNSSTMNRRRWQNCTVESKTSNHSF